MASARALWRATGMKTSDFGKPIIAIANSFTQFVPGHVHLKDLGQMVALEIAKQGAIAKEFNTIAVDDGIAMGHDGMLYSLPSREIIADSVEYMTNAHCADALLCISNCDKITPGMMMAAMRLNIPTVFVSGGPMEAGKVGNQKVDLVDAMIAGGDPTVADDDLQEYERSACPTCGSCSGMFTANSMNCLAEAIGLALPGNGSLLATHKDRQNLFHQAARQLVNITKEYYFNGNASVLPRSIATKKAFYNAMAVDIAMGGSTNTILHLLAIAHEGDVPFDQTDIDDLSRRIPCLCKVAPSTQKYHMEDVHRAGGIFGILGELDKGDLIDTAVTTVHNPSLSDAIKQWDIMQSDNQDNLDFYRAAPGGVPTQQAFSQGQYYKTLDSDRKNGCIRSIENAYSQDGGLAILWGNLAPKGCVVKTAGVDKSNLKFRGKARVFESQNSAVAAILGDQIRQGDVVVIRYEGPKGGPGMQEMLYPTSFLKSKGLGRACALITDGRFSGGTSGLSIGHMSPEAAEQGLLALVADGDIIDIDIPNRTIELQVDKETLKTRRQNELARGIKAYSPREDRERKVSKTLKAYALTAASADRGAVRDLELVSRRISPES